MGNFAEGVADAIGVDCSLKKEYDYYSDEEENDMGGGDDDVIEEHALYPSDSFLIPQEELNKQIRREELEFEHSKHYAENKIQVQNPSASFSGKRRKYF